MSSEDPEEDSTQLHYREILCFRVSRHPPTLFSLFRLCNVVLCTQFDGLFTQFSSFIGGGKLSKGGCVRKGEGKYHKGMDGMGVG